MCAVGATRRRAAGVLVLVLFAWYSFAAAALPALSTLALLSLAYAVPVFAAPPTRALLSLYVVRLLTAATGPRAQRPPPRVPRTNGGCATRAALGSALDFYVLAHALGHAVKAAAVRDRRAVWASALAFEATEAVMAAAAPRVFGGLAECAWDKLVLDLALADALGIEVGLALAGGPAPLRHGVSVAAVAAVLCAVDMLHFAIVEASGVRRDSHWLCARVALLAAAAFPAVRQLRVWEVGRGDGEGMGRGKVRRLPALLSDSPDVAVVVAVVAAETIFCARVLLAEPGR